MLSATQVRHDQDSNDFLSNESQIKLKYVRF